ncbi:ABC transporter permease [Polycladidibacter hongkongensis]|uniref:ABC transporter permease n=1 Tax=Polycladidibacter hongkongensis TaxID=1647556 RepID=UPI000834B68B|nr:ABC transporter permease [Pseudovibrio hongkongensis]
MMKNVPSEKASFFNSRYSASLLLGTVITIVVVGTGVLSFFWLPFNVSSLNVAQRLQPASAQHWLGTDQYGRDLLSMLMIGAQTSLGVGLFAVGFGMLLGVPLGLLAAARRGFVDQLLMRFNDLVFAFPAVLSAILITASLGPGALNSIIAIGIFNVPVFARVARGGALSLAGREFLLAARLAGKGALRITFEHVLPNIASLLIVQATIQLSMGILAEAGLSYLGLGPQPPLVSWGRMLNEAQTLVSFAPQLALIPGATIVVAVLGFNLLGDGLRDLLDPKLRGGPR